jgi:hypothetical protein
LAGLTEELNFELEIKLIDGSEELEKLYGHEVPVIHIDGEHHDFFRVDVERFKSCLYTHRLRQYFGMNNLVQQEALAVLREILDR